eukprot:2127253-Amphidinium_carterae.2
MIRIDCPSQSEQLDHEHFRNMCVVFQDYLHLLFIKMQSISHFSMGLHMFSARVLGLYSLDSRVELCLFPRNNSGSLCKREETQGNLNIEGQPCGQTVRESETTLRSRFGVINHIPKPFCQCKTQTFGEYVSVATFDLKRVCA